MAFALWTPNLMLGELRNSKLKRFGVSTKYI